MDINEIKEKYTRIDEQGDLQVYFMVDHQSFQLRQYPEDMDHAEWMQKQLCTALERLIKQVKEG